MRIVSGIYRGRTLCPFDRIGVRPTSDMARESIFNIIQNKVVGCSFLDLFGGTGAMGIEALSRGAEFVVINDCGKASFSLIKKNLQKLSVTEKVTPINCDFRAVTERYKDRFDVIFIDPPYDSGLGKEAVDSAKYCLKEDGVIIYESEKPVDFTIEGLTVYDERKYGRARFAFFKRA